MYILVVAPTHSDLPDLAIEIAAVERWHDVKLVSGLVRDSDIADAIEDGPFDIIWWVTHGSEAGVLLSDGWLSIAGVGQYLRTSGAKLCILNTCDSEAIALRIVTGGDADIVCTIAPVDNRDAIRLGSLLAGELAHTDEFYEAYKLVAPAGGLYRYLRAKGQYRRRNSGDEVTLQDIYRVLVGDGRFGEVGLVSRVGSVEKRVGAVETRVGGIETRMGDMEAEIIDLSQLIRKRTEPLEGRIILTPGQLALALLGLVILAGALAIALWFNVRGGNLDGSIGFTIRALPVLSGTFYTGL